MKLKNAHIIDSEIRTAISFKTGYHFRGYILNVYWTMVNEGVTISRNSVYTKMGEYKF
jgi:hypothetical protein